MLKLDHAGLTGQPTAIPLHALFFLSLPYVLFRPLHVVLAFRICRLSRRIDFDDLFFRLDERTHRWTRSLRNQLAVGWPTWATRSLFLENERPHRLFRYLLSASNMANHLPRQKQQGAAEKSTNSMLRSWEKSKTCKVEYSRHEHDRKTAG